jgi:hypothetical protein
MPSSDHHHTGLLEHLTRSIQYLPNLAAPDDTLNSPRTSQNVRAVEQLVEERFGLYTHGHRKINAAALQMDACDRTCLACIDECCPSLG